MTHQDSATTRLAEYIASVLPWAHGHQVKGIATFVGAIIEKQSGTQAELARGLGNQEASVKRRSPRITLSIPQSLCLPVTQSVSSLRLRFSISPPPRFAEIYTTVTSSPRSCKLPWRYSSPGGILS